MYNMHIPVYNNGNACFVFREGKWEMMTVTLSQNTSVHTHSTQWPQTIFR